MYGYGVVNGQGFLPFSFLVVNPEIYEQHNQPCKVVNRATDQGIAQLWGDLATVMSIANGAQS